jgi:hypothetical protein
MMLLEPERTNVCHRHELSSRLDRWRTLVNVLELSLATSFGGLMWGAPETALLRYLFVAAVLVHAAVTVLVERPARLALEMFDERNARELDAIEAQGSRLDRFARMIKERELPRFDHDD